MLLGRRTDAPLGHRQVYDAACELDERPFAAAAGAGAGAAAGATPAALPGLLPGGTPPTLTRCTVGTPVRGMGCALWKTLKPCSMPMRGSKPPCSTFGQEDHKICILRLRRAG